MPNKKTRLTESQIRDFKSGRTTVSSPSGLGAHARDLLARMEAEKRRKFAPNTTKREMDRWNKMHQQNIKQEMSRAKKNAPKY
jgi:hypothetical protein